MTTKITLDGDPIPGHHMKIEVTFPIETEDLSGQGSSTADADTGRKAQIIRIRLLIGMKHQDELRRLRKMAAKLDENGARYIYTIENDTTEAMDIRQVKFFQSMSVRDDYRLNAWRIVFELKEHRSVAEKVEEQQATKEQEVREQSANATDVEPAEQEDEQELTSKERLLQNVDNYLGNLFGANSEGE